MDQATGSMASVQRQSTSEQDRKLLESGLFSDATVTCGKKTWSLHRAILASRCLWFSRALEGGFREAESQAVNIEGFDEEQVGWLIDYIYTGVLDIDNIRVGQPLTPTCMDVFDLADFFLMPDLRESVTAVYGTYTANMSTTLQSNFAWQDFAKLGEILDAIRSVYGGSERPAESHFRVLVVRFINESRYRFLRYPAFFELLDELPRFAADLFLTMVRSGEFMEVYYPLECTRCQKLRPRGGPGHYTHAMLPEIAVYAYCKDCVAAKDMQAADTDWKQRHSQWMEKHEAWKKTNAGSAENA
ncbi:Uu.00g121260.m01.CDS01 [Anthostomella pinea]|uniref:Uu.00g121260.m01.CDS01 n=1 Tax=Anthostomella pinea TaxID=933095 RepID=A0AAI8VBQ2_9PEZI|nr:Uu.00g121260.m01.CDS01 [Anthostomella pinea]